MGIKLQAALLADRCGDAYSADRYGSWSAVAAVLLKQGLTERQAEVVMRSKWTRWAADQSDARYGKVPAKVIADFVAKEGMDEVRKLTVETFGEEEV